MKNIDKEGNIYIAMDFIGLHVELIGYEIKKRDKRPNEEATVQMETEAQCR